MRTSSGSVVAATLLMLLTIAQSMPAFAQGGPWWNYNWRFRVSLTADAGSYARIDKPAEVAVNFTELFQTSGQSGALDVNSLRVVEVDAQGNILNEAVAFQFDQAALYDPYANATGTLVILMNGSTPAGAQRHYTVYFDMLGGNYAPATVAPRITMNDDVLDAGQLSYEIITEMGTWYYHKQGGGFSSLLDSQGNDWIGYAPTYPGSAGGGPGRGIPNPVYPRGYFHPGFTSSASTIENIGPLKMTIYTANVADDWSERWEIFPKYARWTMLTGDSTYWILYEGTPGGALEVNKDYMVLSNGTQYPTSATWQGDIPGDEWAYFVDPTVQRSLFMAHHENDTIVDSYRNLDSLMTVFGFGREHTRWSHLTAFPQHLTVGLFDATSYAEAAPLITSAYKDLAVTIGTVEVNTIPARPVQQAPANGAVLDSPDATLRWLRAPLAILYHLEVSEDSTFWGPLTVNDSTIADTVRIVSGLRTSTTYYWRVSGRNATGTGPFSVVWKYTTPGTAPDSVDLLAPADSSLAVADSVRFSWHKATPDAQKYWFELGFDAGFVFRTVDSTLTDTAKVVHSLLPNRTYYWKVRAYNPLGWGPFGVVRQFTTSLTGVEPQGSVPGEFALEQNYPNPFNPSTTIRFALPAGVSVRLQVFNLLGESVATLLDKQMEAGAHAVTFDAESLPNGVYIYRLQAGSAVAVRRMVLLK